MTANQDGTVGMSPEAQLGPSMLEISPTKSVSTDQAHSNFGDAVKKYGAGDAEPAEQTMPPQQPVTPSPQTKPSQAEQVIHLEPVAASPAEISIDAVAGNQITDPKNQTNGSQQLFNQASFGRRNDRPPSPIEHNPEVTLIIDKDVQETIARINEQLETPSMILEYKRRLIEQLTGLKMKFEDMDPVSQEQLIQDTLQQIDAKDLQALQELAAEQIDLTRTDLFKAHAIEDVNLLGYRQEETQ